MKSKDVPQDDADMMRGKWKDPIYTVDEKGNYTTSYSLGWDVKNTVMQQAWDNINEKVEVIRQRVIAGDLSPVAYYMEKNIMDVSLLSKYMGIWKWTVKKHLKQKHFAKLPEETLQKYAEIFNLSVDQLKDINLIKNAEQKE